jgi:hypothetical protein
MLNNLVIKKKLNWAGLDSNQRSVTQRIYNPPPLTTRTPTHYIIHNTILKNKKQY